MWPRPKFTVCSISLPLSVILWKTFRSFYNNKQKLWPHFHVAYVKNGAMIEPTLNRGEKLRQYHKKNECAPTCMYIFMYNNQRPGNATKTIKVLASCTFCVAHN